MKLPEVLTQGKTRWWLAGALAVLLVALLGGGIYWYQATHLPTGVALRVDGVDVTEEQLEEQVQVNRALYGVQPPTEPARLDTFRRDMAKSTAFALLLDRLASERQLAVADRQVSDVLARYITQYYGEGPEGRDRYVQDLLNQGTSEKKVLAELKRRMLLGLLRDQVAAGITVSDDEVRRTFDERRAELAIPERRELHNIVVREKTEADDVVAALHSGANFEQLAQQRSIDGATREQGGNLGVVAAGQLEQPYANIAFGAQVGSVYGPVATPYGFNIGKVVSVQPGTPAEWEKVAVPLKQMLVEEKAADKWQAFLIDELKNANVRYADKYRPASPDAVPDPEAGRPQQPQGAPAPAPGAAPAPSAPAPVPGGTPAPARQGEAPAPGSAPVPGAVPAPVPGPGVAPAPAPGAPAPGAAPVPAPGTAPGPGGPGAVPAPGAEGPK